MRLTSDRWWLALVIGLLLAAALSTTALAQGGDELSGRVVADGELRTVVFPLPAGTIKVNFTDDVAAGDTLNSSVEVEPAGQTDAEKARNRDELEGHVVSVGEREVPVRRGVANWVVPSATAGVLAVVLCTADHHPVKKVDLPCQRAAALAHEGLTCPSTAAVGRPFALHGATTSPLERLDVRFGEQAARPLAQSPRKVVVQTPATPGPTRLTVSDGVKRSEAAVNVVGFRLAVGQSTLRRGEQTALTVSMTGLARIRVPVTVRLVNSSVEVADIRGGNIQTFQVRPEEVKPDGTATRTFTLLGRNPGTFHIRASLVERPDDELALERRDDRDTPAPRPTSTPTPTRPPASTPAPTPTTPPASTPAPTPTTPPASTPAPTPPTTTAASPTPTVPPETGKTPRHDVPVSPPPVVPPQATPTPEVAARCKYEKTTYNAQVRDDYFKDDDQMDFERKMKVKKTIEKIDLGDRPRPEDPSDPKLQKKYGGWSDCSSGGGWNMLGHVNTTAEGSAFLDVFSHALYSDRIDFSATDPKVFGPINPRRLIRVLHVPAGKCVPETHDPKKAFQVNGHVDQHAKWDTDSYSARLGALLRFNSPTSTHTINARIDPHLETVGSFDKSFATAPAPVSVTCSASDQVSLNAGVGPGPGGVGGQVNLALGTHDKYDDTESVHVPLDTQGEVSQNGGIYYRASLNSNCNVQNAYVQVSLKCEVSKQAMKVVSGSDCCGHVVETKSDKKWSEWKGDVPGPARVEWMWWWRWAFR